MRLESYGIDQFFIPFVIKRDKNDHHHGLQPDHVGKYLMGGEPVQLYGDRYNLLKCSNRDTIGILGGAQ